MKLCPEKFPNAYKDGDMCCKFKDELKDGGNSSEFAWKYLCEKTKDNLYLHLEKLWKLDDVPAKAKLKSLEGNWKVNDFDSDSADFFSAHSIPIKSWKHANLTN